MNTKLLFLTIIALIYLSALVQAASDDDAMNSVVDDSNDDGHFGSLPESVDNEEENQEQKGEDVPANTSPTEDANDGDTEKKLINEDVQPENERIRQNTVVADGEFHTVNMKKCEFVEIVLQKKATEIKVDGLFNLQSYMVMSTQFENCDDIDEYSCPEGSFCKVGKSEDGFDTIQLDDEACEVDALFLYAIPEVSSEEISIQVRVTMGDELECDASTSETSVDTDDSGTKTSDSSSETQGDLPVRAEEVCGSYNIDTCQSSEDACSSQCMWVTCGVQTEDGQITNTSSSCVPLVFSQERLQEGCQAENTFASASPENQKIDYPVCAAADQDESEQDPSGPQHSVSKIIGLIILTIFTLFVVVVCFYRCQFRKHGQGPFNPPSFCPGFLFPRQKMSGFMAIGVDRRHEMADYEPPVPVL